jgi:DNA-binding LacI/PurR family transcriptional regulator
VIDGGPTKTEALLSELRRQIVEGRYAPGQRFPTRSELQAKYQISAITVQRVVQRLVEERFVITRGRKRGTFVTERPPHLSRVAIVFNQHPDREWSRFDHILHAEAPAVARQRTCAIESHFGIEPHSDNEGYQQLLRLVENRALAGMIFSDNARMFQPTPLFQTPGIPRVVLSNEQIDEATAVGYDLRGWLDRAMQTVAERGGRRVAMLSFGWSFTPDELTAAAARHGLLMRPHWIQIPFYKNPDAVRHCVQLLMSIEQSERPDALILQDDHFVEPATAALRDWQPQLPALPIVIAYTNEPWPTPSHVPAVRLGFDARDLLHACLDVLERQRRRYPVTGRIPVPPIIAGEREMRREENAMT